MHLRHREWQKQQQNAKCQFVLQLSSNIDFFQTVSNKNTPLNPFCFYNRDHTGGTLWISWIADATLSLSIFHAYTSQSYILLPLWHSINSCIIFTHEGRKTRWKGHGKDEKRFFLNEEHLVFTGGGTGGDFRGGGEGGHDGGEDYIWVLRGVDGRVQAPGAVVLHQRDGLTVVGVQTGLQRRRIVVAAADERLARQLSADKRRDNIRRERRAEMVKQCTSLQWGQCSALGNLARCHCVCLAFLPVRTLLFLYWNPFLCSSTKHKLREITVLSQRIRCRCVCCFVYGRATWFPMKRWVSTPNLTSWILSGVIQRWLTDITYNSPTHAIKRGVSSCPDPWHKSEFKLQSVS